MQHSGQRLEVPQDLATKPSAPCRYLYLAGSHLLNRDQMNSNRNRSQILASGEINGVLSFHADGWVV